MRLVNGNYCVTYGCIRGIYAFPEVSYSVEYQGHDKHINTLVDSLSLEIMCSCHVMYVSLREQREICPLVTEWGQSTIIRVTQSWQFLPCGCDKNEQVTAILSNICSNTLTSHRQTPLCFQTRSATAAQVPRIVWSLKGTEALMETKNQ